MSVSTPVQVTPDPTVDFVPIFADQTEDVILGRMVDWANEGLDPVADASLWVDTREGGHWRTAIIPCVRELARLYDLAGTEVPMSGFLLWAWGTYLDDLAAAYNVQRQGAVPAVGVVTFSGPAATIIDQGTTVSAVPSSPDDDVPSFAVQAGGTIPDNGSGNGSIDLPVQATVGGVSGDVAAGAITAQSTPLPPGVTFTNNAATSGGQDVETDEALRSRALQAILGQGGANVAAYLRWAGAYPGVRQVKVVPTPFGPNSVLVMIADDDGGPLPASVVSGLQSELDPTPGKGSGTAPVGAQVTVETSTLLLIAVVAATITYAPGYSADGVGNTVAVQPGIEAAIGDYMRSVRPGNQVTLSHVLGIIATWEGVVDVTGVTLNGAAANVTVGLSPPQSARLSTLTL